MKKSSGIKSRILKIAAIAVAVAVIIGGVIFAVSMIQKDGQSGDEPNAPVILDTQQMFKDYVAENKEQFMSFDSYKTDVEPILTILDFDQDGTEEVVVTVNFNNTDAVSKDFIVVHVLGIKDEKVVKVFSSDIVAKSRMTERIRIFRDTDEKVYLYRSLRDGQQYQTEVVYSYADAKFTAEYSLTGDMTKKPAVFEKGIDKDAFVTTEGFAKISEKDFKENVKNLETRGETYYFSNDLLP